MPIFDGQQALKSPSNAASAEPALQAFQATVELQESGGMVSALVKLT